MGPGRGRSTHPRADRARRDERDERDDKPHSARPARPGPAQEQVDRNIDRLRLVTKKYIDYITVHVSYSAVVARATVRRTPSQPSPAATN